MTLVNVPGKQPKSIRLGMSRTVYQTLLLLTVCMATVLACSTTAGLPNRKTTSGVSEAKRSQTLVLAGGQPRTLDPALTHSGPAGPIGAIFSGLVGLDQSLQVIPELAAGWEVIEDRTIYTFYIRQNATFHNGRPVTAQDVVYSWERALNPATGSDTAITYLGDIVGATAMYNGTSDSVSGLRVIDDKTLEVKIDSPKSYFLSKLTYPVAFVIDKENVIENEWQNRPNGTGPFRLVEWRDDEILILSRFDGHYLDPTTMEQVIYLMGAGIPLNMYEKGESDLVGIGGSTLERVLDPNNPLAAELRITPNMCTSYLGFNTREPPFDDFRVRQAFNYALDRQKLVSGLYKGNALLADGILPPGIPGFTGDVGGYGFNPERAQALLVEAGYEKPEDFPTVTFTTAGYGDVGALETATITMWQEELGVSIQPLLVDPYSYLDELYAGNTGNIFTSGWCADYPDPENFLDLLFHSDSAQNLTGYSAPDLDALLEEARVEGAVARRLALYHQIERELVRDAPAVFLVHSISAELVKPDIRDYSLTPIGVAQWHLISKEN